MHTRPIYKTSEASMIVRIRRAADLLLIASLPVASAFYLWQALNINVRGSQVLMLSPRALPTIIGALMVLAATATSWHLYKARRERETDGVKAPDEPISTMAAIAEEDEGDGDSKISSWTDLAVTVGALTLFVLLFAPFGFRLSAFLLLAGLATYFKPRNWLRHVVIFAVFIAVLDYLFTSLLGVRLPLGVIPFTY